MTVLKDSGHRLLRLSLPLAVTALFAVTCIFPNSARAVDGMDPMGFRNSSYACGPFPAMGSYEAENGALAYCVNQNRPSPGTGALVSYNKGWSWENGVMAAIVFNGYPFTSTIGGKTLSEGDAHAATQMAIWMAQETTKPNGDYDYVTQANHHVTGSFSAFTDIVNAARWLYENARSGIITAPRNRMRLYSAPKQSENVYLQAMLYIVPEVSVEVAKTSGNASVTLGNGEYELKGAVFDIFQASNDNKVATVTTGSDGKAQCQLAPDTAYYAIETTAPKGFAKSSERISFKTNSQGGSFSVSDMPATVSLKLTKADAATGKDAQPGATLAGAQYTCVSQSTQGWKQTATADAQGNLKFTGIPLGTCVVTETKAPEGYLPDTEEHIFTVSAKETEGQITVERTATLSETPIAFDLQIAKFKDYGSTESEVKDPAEGVSFNIISNTTGKTVGTITTNKKGYADTSTDTSLWFGAGKRPANAAGAIPYDRKGYTVEEDISTVPAGFKQVDSWTLSATDIANGAKLQYIVDNHAITTRLQIVKLDADTGRTVPLKGFSFQLLNGNRQPVSQEVWYPSHTTLTSFTTDESGTVTLPQSIMPGTYYVRETAAVCPYLLQTEDVPVVISADEKIPAVCVVNVSDKQATGKATVLKKEAGSTKALANAEFDVVARETITAPDGTIQTAKNAVLAHVTTDTNGIATVENLPLGSGTARYAFVETKAPDKYLLDSTPHEFELSYNDQSTPVVSAYLEIENDYTKVDISKVSITGSNEIPGASLVVTDANGNKVDSWTSTDKPHRINHLEPGTYTLTETLSPRTYDVAKSIDFTVEATGKVQQASMKDAPIEISAQIDKRQQIAQPTATGVEANGDGANKASTTISDDGSFAYTVDFRNTSNTWTDEFTVEDTLDGVKDGLSQLVSIETPEAGVDFDGLLNVWYLTDADCDGDANLANATREDEHDNPWLDTKEVIDILGDDGRALDYRGWHLWKQSVSATSSETLSVADLNLPATEHIVAFRFEYGRVETGFSTRAADSSDWDRAELKDPHDDIEALPLSNENEHQGKNAQTYRPAIVHMHVTDSYTEGTILKNTAEVHAFRNGGGEKLEGHDYDSVEQQPKLTSTPLAQTGTASLSLITTATGIACLASSGLCFELRRHIHK